jgi:glycosyltransferase involved in cell wall biosynthesis
MSASPADPLPAISIILPVFNGLAFVERAIRSVLTQTFSSWELLAVDDASGDQSYELLRRHAETDPRIRAFRLSENRGTSAARNHALHQARGKWIAYLDHDDEYYSRYLEEAHAREHLADVLVFAYDIIEERPGFPGFGRITTWNPAEVRERLFQQHIAVPLAVAHRRELLDRVGLFNETRGIEEDTELWCRFANANAKFLFLPEKCGLYHVRPDSQARLRPLTSSAPPPVPPKRQVDAVPHSGITSAEAPKGRILFASPHCYLDPSNGAALCVRDLLELLTNRGWTCEVFCGPQLDFEQGESIEQLLADQQLGAKVHRQTSENVDFALYRYSHAGVGVTIYRPTASKNRRDEPAVFVDLFERVQEKFHADLLLTYGSDVTALRTIAAAKRNGLPVVFWLHNLAYHSAEPFQGVDRIVVPSRFAQEHYRKTLKLDCTPIPGPWKWERVRCEQVQGRYVTFVNPQPYKGVFFFARIAHELGRRRPDIPFLVVEGRAKANLLNSAGLNLGGGNVFVMANTPDPRDFFQVSKLVVMPSLVQESFPRVPVEAFINGIPVLASTRGGLPETLAEAGLLFDVPEKYTPASRGLPTAEEVEPWLTTIMRLWDDSSAYEEESRKCRVAAEAWLPERLLPRFEELFVSTSSLAKR